MPITTRPITLEEVHQFRDRFSRGFGQDIPDEDREPDRFLSVVPLDRSVAAFDDDDIVGCLATFPFEVTVPGGASVPMGGTTMVAVQPTHRRRGVLTAMMRDHIEDCAARGEPLIGLWASESSIYGRYGFGAATENDDVKMVGSRVGLPENDAASTVRFVEVDEAAEVLPPVYERVRSGRPGMLTRSEAFWALRFRDPPHHRRGKSAYRIVVSRSGDTVDGYALYRQKSDWDDGYPNGTVAVVEVVTESEAAHTALWRFLTNIDLFPNITYWNLPVDDPLRWKATFPRRIERRRWDALWVRVLAVPEALSARTYAEDGRFRFTLEDPFRPENDGTYEIAVDQGKGHCSRVDGVADVSLGADVLGSLYLGGGDAVAAHAAGRIRGDRTAVVALNRAFRGDVQPWCEEIF